MNTSVLVPAIPLALRLRRSLHRKIAEAQDLIVIETYNYMESAVLHGGTAVWRCYGSSRFSEDLDFYLNPEARLKLEIFRQAVEDVGLRTLKFKVSMRSVYSRFEWKGVTVSFEAIFKQIRNYTTMRYELVDGNYIMVYTLAPEDLIREKVDVYLERRRIRDLYDILHLLDHVEDKNTVKKDIERLLEHYSPPIDSEELKTLIYAGSAPKADEIHRWIEKWAK